jgi:hypothetical protein
MFGIKIDPMLLTLLFISTSHGSLQNISITVFVSAIAGMDFGYSAD